MSKTNVVLTIPEPKKFELVEKPYPKIKAGYAIVKNEYAGVCLEGSRIWTRHGFEKFYGGGQSDYPDGLGHESVGVVDEVMPGSNFKPGDRVIIFQGDHCGHCHACQQRAVTHLLFRQHLSAQRRHDESRHGRDSGLE